MAGKPDGAAPNSEAAAHRRWLITIAITILFGTFGAVMTYLSYSKGSKPWSPAKTPSSAPSSGTSTAPASAASEAAAPAEVPSRENDGDNDDKGKPDNDKPDKDK